MSVQRSVPPPFRGSQADHKQMYNKHIIAALARHLEILAQTLTRIQQPTDTMTDASADEPKEIRQAWDWAENVVTIFWSIACALSRVISGSVLSQRTESWLPNR